MDTCIIRSYTMQIKVNFKKEDYQAIYPELQKSIFENDPALKFLLGGMIAFLVLGASCLMIDKPGFALVAGLAMIIFSIYFIIRTSQVTKRKAEINQFVQSNAPFSLQTITLDEAKIKLTYADTHRAFFWQNLANVSLESEYLVFYSERGAELIIPRGDIEADIWLKIQDFIIERSEKLMATNDQSSARAAQ